MKGRAPTVRKLWPFGWVREIPRPTGRYLTRYSVREQKPTGGGGWRVYLHRFWSGDQEVHDHPWSWSFSVILWGSYTETYADLIPNPWQGPGEPAEVLGPLRTRRVRWFNWIGRKRFHQITELHPGPGGVWTLFFSGPRHGQSWGFWVPGRGKVRHNQFRTEKGLPSQ